MPGNNKKHRRGNGEGSIYQRKNGSWAAAITTGTKPDGKPDRKFLYGKTRKEVAEKLRTAQNNLDVGVLPGGNNITFGTWITHWLEFTIKPGIKNRTYVGYCTSVYKHVVPGIGKYKLKDLTEEIIQDYLNEQMKTGNLRLIMNPETGEVEPCNGPVAASTIIQQRRLIIAAVEYAVEKRRIPYNVAKKTKRPKVSKNIEVLSNEDVGILARNGKKYRYYPAYMLTLTTGCRRGEILGLGWKFVDIGIPWATVDKYFPWKAIEAVEPWDTTALKKILKDHNITLGDGFLILRYQLPEGKERELDELKTPRSRRTLMVTEETVLILIYWRMLQNREKKRAKAKGEAYNKDDLVFTTQQGRPVKPNNFTRGWGNSLNGLNIEHKRFHDLRHTVATAMLEDGEAINTVQEQLGHYDAGFTASRYGHVTAKMRNSAAVKLGDRLKNARGTEVPEEPVEKVTAFPTKEGSITASAAYKIK